MKITRRHFVGSLLAGGVIGSVGLNHVSHAAGTHGGKGQFAPVEHGINGYPVTLGSGGPRAAWSVAPGETVYFALSAPHDMKGHLHLQSVDGEKLHDFGEVSLVPQAFQSDAPWLDGAGYAPTVAWSVPEGLASGVYFMNGLPDIFVNVRADAAHLPPAPAHSLTTAVLLPTNTINAYSTTLGRSAYAHPTRVPVVNFMRPFNASREQGWLGTVKWLSEEPLFGQPRFLIDQDLEREQALDGVQLLVIAGHSEYWTRRARESFDAFVASGGHVIVASGNVMWWQVRYEDEGQRMVSYKYDDARVGLDPERDPRLVTRGWNSHSLAMPIANSIGGDFARGGFGSRRNGLDVRGTGLRVTDPHHPLFEGLELAECAYFDFGGVREYDGAPIRGLDIQGQPVADKALLGAHRLEILASEWTRRGDAITLATAHLYQRRKDSGTVLHLGAGEAVNGNAEGCAMMREACHEFVRRLLAGESPFADRAPRELALAMTTPWSQPFPAFEMSCRDARPA